MSHKSLFLFLFVLIIVSTYSHGHLSTTPAPITSRVFELLSQMTLNEKADELISTHDSTPTQTYGILDWSNIGDACNENDILCRIKARNKMQQSQMNMSRLNIPVTFREETAHSSCNGGTIFPVPILLGSTWNLTLFSMIGSIIASEARFVGIDLGFSPILQVLTDPRFGRFTESYASDAILVTHYGYAMSKALTGGTPFNEYVPSNYINNEGKHFLGYAAAGKDALPLDCSERTLREIYLRPWQGFVASGGKSIMCAHNAVNSVPMHANHKLITTVMRNEFNWSLGLVGTDCGDIEKLYSKGGPWELKTGFHTAIDSSDATIKSLNAGVDISLCDDVRKEIVDAVNDKKLNISTVNRAVTNLLTAKFAIGLFDKPFINENITQNTIDSNINNKSSQQLAKEAALQGIVLLKNEHNILPFNPSKIKNLGVIGPVADYDYCYYGPYSNTGANITTILDALNTLYPNINVSFSEGVSVTNLTINITLLNEAINIAKSSDHIIIMVGDTGSSVGEGVDRVGLELSGGQLELINQITKIKPNKTVVVLLNGRPTTFGTGLYNTFSLDVNNIYNTNITRDNALLNNQIHALLSAYHPGQQGGNALVDIIFGLYNPNGRLSTSWPQSAAHIHSGHGMHSPWTKSYNGDNNKNYVYNTIAPLFPFGFGLSYINEKDIIHGDKILIKETIPNCLWTVTLNVTNKNGVYDYFDVIQIYFTKWVSKIVRYELSLAGFNKVYVPKGGKTIEVNVNIYADSLAYYDIDSHQWILEQGTYYLYDGKNAKQFNYYSTTAFNITKQINNPCKFWDAINH